MSPLEQDGCLPDIGFATDWASVQKSTRHLWKLNVLFALVLAIGMVVDAAIIVLENTERLMHEQKLAVREATLAAVKQVTGPLVASALVLLAIFLPVSALPGLTGGIFEQFGIVLSGAVLISTVVALSLAPPLCVLLLRENHGEQAWFFRQFNRLFDSLTTAYTGLAMFFSRHLLVTAAVFVLLLGSVGWMFQAMPQSLAPREDAGSFFVEVELPPASSLPRTEALVERMVADVLAVDGVRDVVSVSGYSLLNSATSSNVALMIVTLDDWSERPGPAMSQAAIFGRVGARLDTYKEALVLLFASPTIPGLGMTAGFEMLLEDTLARSPEELAVALDNLLQAAEAAPEIGLAYSLFRADVPQLYLEVDRARIKRMGIPINEVFTALQTQLGGM